MKKNIFWKCIQPPFGDFYINKQYKEFKRDENYIYLINEDKQVSNFFHETIDEYFKKIED